jgi:hypothetical protein
MQFWPLPTAALNVQTRKVLSATVACATILSLGLTLASIAQNSPCPLDPAVGQRDCRCLLAAIIFSPKQLIQKTTRAGVKL